MSAREECESELEVLQSIYDDNLAINKKKFPQTFTISIEAHTSTKSQLVLKCKIKFIYNTSYPEKPPSYEITNPVNIKEAHIAMFMLILKETAESSLGFMMVYDMVSKVQEKLNDIAEAWQENLNQEEERLRQLKEAEEEAKFIGTKVTVESFMKWKREFLEEKERNISAEEKREKELEKEISMRTTGKALFLKDNRFDDSDLKFLDEGDDGVEIDEKLFENIDGLHLDDLEDMSEDDMDSAIMVK